MIAIQGLRRWAVKSWTEDRLLIFFVIGALAARMTFWLFTDRVWEDALITITPARNAVRGLGLTHHATEGHVHSFTSAVSVLIPLVGEFLHSGWGMLFLRVASLIGAAISVVYGYRVAGELKLGTWPTVFALSYLAFDQNQIFYGMAGMETQVAVAVLLAGTYFLLKKDGLRTGALLGLGILARPDFLIWVLPALIALVIFNRREALKAAAVTSAVIAPWVIFTTAYYGSPIPHTVHVKANAYIGPVAPDRGSGTFDAWVGWLGDRWEFQSQTLWQWFAPFRQNSPITHAPIPDAGLKTICVIVVALAVLGIWRFRRNAMWLAPAAYVGGFWLYRFLYLPNTYFEWYLPPVMALVALSAACGLDVIGSRVKTISAVGAAAMALLFTIHIPFTFPLEARIQHQIENKVRLQLGQHLGRVASPGDTVTSESSGYVGYYGGDITLYDYPGLTSKVSYKTLRDLPPERRSLQSVIVELRPDWVVLRPFELEGLKSLSAGTAALYELDKRFFVPESESRLTRWGVSMGNIDREFFLMKRKAG